MRSYLLSLSLLGAIVLGSVACKDEGTDPVKQSTITANPGALGFIYKRSTVNVAVVSPTEWEITGHENWIEPSRPEGTSSFLSVAVKPSTQDRRGRILLQNAVGDTTSVSVAQTGMPAGELIVEPLTIPELSGESEGDSAVVAVYTLEEYSVTSNDDWISISGKNNASFSVNVGYSTADRSGTVTVVSGENTRTVTIEQKASLLGEKFTRLDIAQYWFEFYPIEGFGYFDSYNFAILTEDFALASDGKTPVSGKGISFELLAPPPTDYNNPNLAAGTYTLNRSRPEYFSILRNNNLSNNLSYAIITDHSPAKLIIDDGTLEVEVDEAGNYRLLFDVVLLDETDPENPMRIPLKGYYEGGLDFTVM